MKTLKGFMRALRVKPIYAENFSEREDVFSNFNKPEDKDIQICYACYDTPPYEGSALVFYYRKSTKKYYEAYGSHCSCYGLEDQWDADEELNVIELEARLSKGYLQDGDIFRKAFEEWKGI